MDKKIQKYKIEGKIAFWKFMENSKNYPGWNISFDKIGRQSLIELLEMMNNSQWPSKKELKLSSPFELNQDWIKTNGTFQLAESVIISNKKTPIDLWELKDNNSNLIISIGNDKLFELKSKIVEQIFDECIYGNKDVDSDILYFW